MARTLAEIKKQMTDAFLADSVIRERYGISDSKRFEEVFSKVSVESVIFYAVAMAAWTLETLFDLFKMEVNEQIAQNVVPTVRWYHTQAMGFQYGDALVYDDGTEQFHYPSADETKKVVRYCSIKDRGGSIQILVAGDAGGKPSILPEGALAAFKSYMNSIKVAGVILDVKSLPADNIRIVAMVQVDPQIIESSGRRIADGAYVVVEAIDAYLANIVYGGTFNKTKCVDAIQNVEGVIDVTLTSVKAKTAPAENYAEIMSNNYTAAAGCFISDSLNTSIVYVV